MPKSLFKVSRHAHMECRGGGGGDSPHCGDGDWGEGRFASSGAGIASICRTGSFSELHVISPGATLGRFAPLALTDGEHPPTKNKVAASVVSERPYIPPLDTPQEDLSFKISGPPLAGTIEGPWEEGGHSHPPHPPSNTFLVAAQGPTVTTICK